MGACLGLTLLALVDREIWRGPERPSKWQPRGGGSNSIVRCWKKRRWTICMWKIYLRKHLPYSCSTYIYIYIHITYGHCNWSYMFNIRMYRLCNVYVCNMYYVYIQIYYWLVTDPVIHCCLLNPSPFAGRSRTMASPELGLFFFSLRISCKMPRSAGSCPNTLLQTNSTFTPEKWCLGNYWANW